MLRKVTLSEKIILAVLALMIATVIQYGYSISHHMELKMNPCNSGVEIGKGDLYYDTLQVSYHHLYVNFNEIEFDPKLQNEVRVMGYENVRDLIKIDVRNDTLYITPQTECSPKPVKTIGNSAIDVKVGAIGIKSITLAKDAQIRTPLKAIGSDKEGWPRYREGELEKYQVNFDSLQLHMYDQSTFNLIVNCNKLDLSFTDYSGQTNTLNGTCETLEIHQIEGDVALMAINLKAANVRVNSQMNRKKMIRGAINVHCTNRLEAFLYDQLDVFYKGNPEIKKEEVSSGRIVNING